VVIRVMDMVMATVMVTAAIVRKWKPAGFLSYSKSEM